MCDVLQADPTNVVNCHQAMQLVLSELLKPYGLVIQSVADDEAIPGSFFGEREAGLIKHCLYLRHDTPVHSALHEACHYICMPPDRRANLDTNAEGDFDEENGVCYLQILLAQHVSGMGTERMMRDMDSWGYSFRLGSAKAWFESDADDAKRWLQQFGIINQAEDITWHCRQTD